MFFQFQFNLTIEIAEDISELEEHDRQQEGEIWKEIVSDCIQFFRLEEQWVMFFIQASDKYHAFFIGEVSLYAQINKVSFTNTATLFGIKVNFRGI
ncbi:unnamed protein product [Hymenolepis diminuta]|uniref:Uncharacterized protein n=1 Tax=Hymenolepis diminuta TaxID=6216 RepID=A0A564Y018_HYMDI|nr:unnamed protein product [Hymenolepis diminuta]